MFGFLKIFFKKTVYFPKYKVGDCVYFNKEKWVITGISQYSWCYYQQYLLISKNNESSKVTNLSQFVKPVCKDSVDIEYFSVDI